MVALNLAARLHHRFRPFWAERVGERAAASWCPPISPGYNAHMANRTLSDWESEWSALIKGRCSYSAHDFDHVDRVVSGAKEIALEEGARLDVVVPAAWLHDIVTLPKDHPARHLSSKKSASAAYELLQEAEYPSGLLPDIVHCIEAHSFSAGIEPRSLEAWIVQDADRLDAMGAIGIARCFATAGALNFSSGNSPRV